MMRLIYYTRFLVAIAAGAVLWCFPYSLPAQPGDPALADPGSPIERHVIIRMESYVFTPSEIVVEAGNTIILTLVNESFLVPHNFLLDDPGGTRLVEAEVSSGDRQDVTLTVTEPGTYPFYCDKQLFFFPNHREEGMEGRLIVQ